MWGMFYILLYMVWQLKIYTQSSFLTSHKFDVLETIVFCCILQGHVEDVRRQVNEAVQSRHVSFSIWRILVAWSNCMMWIFCSFIIYFYWGNVWSIGTSWRHGPHVSILQGKVWSMVHLSHSANIQWDTIIYTIPAGSACHDLKLLD